MHLHSYKILLDWLSRCGQGGDSEDNSDPEFLASEEGSEASSEEEDLDADSDEEEGEEDAGHSRMRPKRVAQNSGWEARAAKEAEAMVAAAESSNMKAADVGQSILHKVCACAPLNLLRARWQGGGLNKL